MEEEFCVQNLITIKKFPIWVSSPNYRKGVKNSYKLFIIDKIEDSTIDQT